MKKSLILLALALLLAGCSGRISSVTYYFYPAFTKDNNILCLKEISRSEYNAVNSQLSDDTYDYITTMDQSGSDEAEFSEISADAPIAELNHNPVEELAAYLSDISSGLGNKIIIRSVPTSTAYSGPEELSLYFRNLRSFDWDNTGAKIVFCNSSGEIHVVSLDGLTENIIATAEAEEVAWKYGARIAYLKTGAAANTLYLINSDGTGIVNTGVTGLSDIQICGANTNLIYAKKGTSFESIDVTNPLSPVETPVIASFDGASPRLSPSGDKVVYYKDGIWIYSGGTATKLK